jgi:polar amino acid transport system substrate-binding protein
MSQTTRHQTGTGASPVRRAVRTLGLASGLLALALPLAACGSDDGGSSAAEGDGLGLISSDTLTVCSDVPYPPFDLQKGGEYTGFDGDVINAIADELGVEVRLQDSSFDALQSGLALNSDQCDVVAAAMTITEEREENIDFTEGYYDSRQSLLVPEGSDITSIEDLAGKRVAVQQGTTGQTYAEENAPEGAELITFPGDAEMYTAIRAGQVDAILQDYPPNFSHQQDGGFTIVEDYDTGEQYGFAVREEGSEELLKALNEGLVTLEEEGTLQEIYEKYFSAQPTG